ncbi:hypothetical protein GCM10011344_43570 [Dokdonia pacifica]|uniref:Outer membrane protein assembly factor BamA n=1 Tax=Dokdonia pacifica TaxID=1627892 RepID=A0A239ADU1_9FLAO|nr:DUF5686 family protein [Dokdonia pacifica]GGG38027.1 hypothetical protein GCM10011344_43570 [Dokdonia pacifica]SNR93817.1 hypothetical protein SAMN06265376_104363 [Dokdonia pacifica]
MYKILAVLLCIQISTFAQTESGKTAEELIQKAISLRDTNDPRAVLSNYAYTSYEKTIITDSLSTSTHSYLSEKVSNTTYTTSQGFIEDIIGFQLAGFEKTRYEVLAVNLQSRSFYDEDFVIFNTRYAGILSRRGLRNYTYNIVPSDSNDEIHISFTPKRPKAIPGLSGVMVLDKEKLALKNVQVSLDDAIKIKLSQSYIFNKEANLYLPKNRALFIDKGDSDRRLSFFGGRISIGTLQEENLEEMITKKYLVSTTSNSDFSLKAKEIEIQPYAITIEPDATEKPQSFWQNYRSEDLTNKDKRSFSEIERIINAENIERRLGTINNFSVGYYSVNFFDFDLTYPVKFNNFEGLRLGLGGVTNESFSKRFRIEGYGAYGFKDKEIKYGAGGGILLDSKKDAWLSLTYNSDLEEVGNYAYLTDRRVYSLFEPRLVNINLFYKHRTTRTNLEYRIAPKLLSEFQVAHRRIEQTTPYRYINDGEEISNYNITELTAGVRWSPGSKFMKTESGINEVYDGYPKVTAQISQSIDGLEGDFNFTKIGAKVFYRLDRLNKSATELLVEGNVGFGDLPITHLFQAYPNAPTKETILQRFSVAGVNSFETMFFSEFFSDRLLTAQLKHRLAPFNISKNFKPEMVFITRFAIGDISNPEDHLDIQFGSLREGYTESGFEINKLIFGFGTSLTYRYGAYHLPNFEDNIAFKFTFNLQL